MILPLGHACGCCRDPSIASRLMAAWLLHSASCAFMSLNQVCGLLCSIHFCRSPCCLMLGGHAELHSARIPACSSRHLLSGHAMCSNSAYAVASYDITPSALQGGATRPVARHCEQLQPPNIQWTMASGSWTCNRVSRGCWCRCRRSFRPPLQVAGPYPSKSLRLVSLFCCSSIPHRL